MQIFASKMVRIGTAARPPGAAIMNCNGGEWGRWALGLHPSKKKKNGEKKRKKRKKRGQRVIIGIIVSSAKIWQHGRKGLANGCHSSALLSELQIRFQVITFCTAGSQSGCYSWYVSVRRSELKIPQQKRWLTISFLVNLQFENILWMKSFQLSYKWVSYFRFSSVMSFVPFGIQSTMNHIKATNTTAQNFMQF